MATAVAILRKRGMVADGDTSDIPMSDGYYAVVNGYGKAFLDEEATTSAGSDRYAQDTTFNQIYQLFLFDRELYAVAFRMVMCTEAIMRSVLSYIVCKHHRFTNADLRRNCHVQAGEYLRGPHVQEDDLI